MRALLVLLALSAVARAQDSTLHELTPEQAEQKQTQQAQPAQQGLQPQEGSSFGTPGTPQLSAPAINRPSAEMAESWRRPRMLSTFGSVLGLLGAALSVSSVVL